MAVKKEPVVIKKESTSLMERLVPVLLLVSIALAFIVGVLWQRVSSLQNGGTANTVSQGTVQGSGSPAPSVLSDLPSLAKKAGVDQGKFEACTKENKFKNKVQAFADGGVKAGVQGTPAIFVFNNKGEVWFVPGAFPFSSMKPVLDVALGKSSAALPQGVEKLDAARIAKIPKISDTDHVRGDKNAKVKMVEYSDYQCPYCKQFHPTTLQALQEYGKDVAHVLRHFPLDGLHPLARGAAEASECVFDLGGDTAFWKFTDLAFGV